MTHVHRPDDQGLCACGYDASPEPHVVEVIAQVPPQAPDALTMYCAARRFDSNGFLAALASRDAALLAPLRAEVERLNEVVRLRTALELAAEAEIARLREALRPFAAIQPTPTMPDGDKFVVVWDGSLLWADVDPKLVGAWSGVTAADLRAAARALAEGGGR